MKKFYKQSTSITHSAKTFEHYQQLIILNLLHFYDNQYLITPKILNFTTKQTNIDNSYHLNSWYICICRDTKQTLVLLSFFCKSVKQIFVLWIFFCRHNKQTFVLSFFFCRQTKQRLVQEVFFCRSIGNFKNMSSYYQFTGKIKKQESYSTMIYSQIALQCELLILVCSNFEIFFELSHITLC